MLTDRRARFEEIYAAYSGLILAYAARRTGDADDAADVAAETFIVAWRRMDDVPEGAMARPWLYGVARRVLPNQRRGSERRRRLHDRIHAEYSQHFGDAFSTRDEPDLARISEALAQLAEADRELLTLVAWDGLRREEIALMLGCSTTAVRVRLHRARKRFAERLDARDVKHPLHAGHESPRGAPALPDPEEA